MKKSDLKTYFTNAWKKSVDGKEKRKMYAFYKKSEVDKLLKQKEETEDGSKNI